MEVIKTYDPNNTLWKAISAGNKVTNLQLQAIDISAVIDDATQKGIGLKEGTVVLNASAVVNVKRMKLLLDDCTRVFQIISKERHTSVRSFKMPSEKHITLAIEGGNLYINDEMIEFDTEMVVSHDDLSLLDNTSATGDVAGHDIDFGELSNIEQVRESTVMTDSLVMPREDLLKMKRKRVIEDKIAEYDHDDYRCEIKSVRGIVNKIKQWDIRDKLKSLIIIDPKIARHLSQLKTHIEDDVEMQRLSSLGGDAGFGDFDFQDGTLGEEAKPTSETVEAVVDSDGLNLFDLSNLPQSFEFCSIVEEYTRPEKSHCFMKLLQLLSNRPGAIAKQQEPFGPIFCELV